MLKNTKEMVENFSKAILYSSKSDEINRLTELYELNILDTKKEEQFDRITKLVSDVFSVPTVVISLIDEKRQWMKSVVGVDVNETPREQSICQHVLVNKNLMVIEDLQRDERFQNNPLVKEFNISFYAGAPLVTEKGNILGTLCLIDVNKRIFSKVEREQLQSFANLAVDAIESKKSVHINEELREKLIDVNAKYSNLVNSISDVVFQLDIVGNWTYLTPSWEKLTGFTVKESLNTPAIQFFSEESQSFLRSLFEQFPTRYEETYTYTLKFYTHSKIQKFVRVNASILTNKENEITGMTGTLSDITDMVELEQERKRDLEVARSVQGSVLSPPLHDERIQINSEYRPSLELSGDMYYWEKISPTTYGVFLMDVMGHGVSSSLISMSIRSLLKGLVTRVQDPVKITEELNRHMKELIGTGEGVITYFTSICLLVNTSEKIIEYVNAGHPFGIVSVDRTNIIEINKGSIPVGLIEQPPIEKGRISYDKEATIVLYTDGLSEVSETKNTKELIIKMLENHQSSEKQSLANKILKSCTLPQKLPDDICVISIDLE
ncbi:SpoIIE family protein phosphatase [Litchfieldia alkalitelluris]|uniref:SpoIIE family protein phosphatase n=1 Tax=Litchfieldia alkalitelluris TaxID=304268 RepID=UPI000997F247|nr:SpoIIE family protein phosphatase [Litchfieldia alkalitelluris]